MRTHPYTLAEVERMHETALSRQSPEALAAAGADLGALAAAEALRNRQSGKADLPPGDGLDTIASPDTRQSFETAFDTTSAVYDHISLTVPSPEQLAESGVDFARLSSEYERMTDEGLQPEIVIAPQNLSLDNAKALYSALRQNSAIPNNPLKRQDDGDGLWVSDDVASVWNALVSDEANQPQLPDGTKPPFYLDGLRHAWMIRLIPGTDRPTDTNVDHTTNDAVHPTIAEYLTLQATRIQSGETPVDSNTYTWLNGTFEDNGLAPDGLWFSDRGQVVVSWYYVDYRSDRLGSRLPVW